ncbi:hypothetical protein PWT90_05827 [Aphanocladium album]|nr:hypothetical protein PWT90_05827 [Aphanocladium album]
MRSSSPEAAPGRLRRSDRKRREPPPFPAQQMFVLDFNITDDPSKISVYAGMVTSAFTLAEFATGVLWGRLSDRIGRKPVLLSGLAGTALSVLIFGFAPSLPVALFARALGGLLNGNIGVLQTTVAELVTVKEQQHTSARAYTIMPMVWCIGSIVGPMIGGALARPCISYPELFAKGTIWDRYPYLLPNLFSACTVAFGVIVGLLFLDETHAKKKLQRDRCREVGDRIAAFFSRAGSCKGRAPEKQSLLHDSSPSGYSSISSRTPSLLSEDDEPLPSYKSQESSPKLGPSKVSAASAITRVQSERQPKMRIFTRPVIMNIMSYGILAFHTMTFDQLFPVFLSTSPPDHPVQQLPFKFVDGFGLDTKTIGVIMSAQGLYSLFSNYLVVAPVTRRLGSLRLFRLIAFSYFSLYLVTPYLVLLPESMRMPAIYLLVIWKCTFATMAYPSNAILLANSAPSKEVLGTINGIAASTASLCRALGPTVSGFLYALGLQTGYSGLAWWFSGATTLVGAYLSSQITEGGYKSAASDEEEESLLDSMVDEYDEEESV